MEASQILVLSRSVINPAQCGQPLQMLSGNWKMGACLYLLAQVQQASPNRIASEQRMLFQPHDSHDIQDIALAHKLRARPKSTRIG
jgi:hypothetical protein